MYFTYNCYHIVQTTGTFQSNFLSNRRDWSIKLDPPQPLPNLNLALRPLLLMDSLLRLRNLNKC